MNYLDIFQAYLTVFTTCLAIIPLWRIQEWQKRGTAAGFSSVPLVIPVLMQSCWLRHSMMSDEGHSPIMLLIHMTLGSASIVAFAYYAPVRKYLLLQLGVLATVMTVIFTYVGSIDDEASAASTMGRIAAITQNINVCGYLYELKRAYTLKTTEYIPARLTFALFAMTTQWMLFSILAGKFYVMLGTFPGLIATSLTLVMYNVYPPITWRVPIFGTQQTDRKLK